MKMNPLLKSALLKTNFVQRYRALSNQHTKEHSFEDYEKGNVSEIISALGYSSKFVKNGAFFQITQKIENYTFQLNINLKYGLVELIIAIYLNQEFLDGDPFGYLCSTLDEEQKIPKASFANYDELREILKEGFSMFEDIKKEILSAHP
jgi:hypothetical protein